MIDVPQSHQLTVSRPAEAVLQEAQKAAAALTTVLANKADKVMINGKQYLEYEDWQTVARFYNVTAKVTETKYVEFGTVHGFEAKAVAIRADGMEISAAESMCLDNEDRWEDRDLFQIKSMAQTRACAKALRNVLAWVVVLGGYGSTPAEELDGVRRQQQGQQGQPQAQAAADGTVTIKSVKPKEGGGTGGKKAWTRYDVQLSDGTRCSTFDKKLGERADALCKAGTRLKLQDGTHLKKSEDGKFTDLVDLPDGEAKKEPLTAEQQVMPPVEPPIAEKILTSRELKDTQGHVWIVVQGSEREYYAPTDSDAAKTIAQTIRDFKETKAPLVFKYDWKPSKNGPRRVVTGLADVDTLEAPKPQVAAGDAPSAEELAWS